MACVKPTIIKLIISLIHGCFLTIFVSGILIFIGMSTYRELTYMVLDQLKLASDDSYYTEDHVKFLLSASNFTGKFSDVEVKG